MTDPGTVGQMPPGVSSTAPQGPFASVPSPQPAVLSHADPTSVVGRAEAPPAAGDAGEAGRPARPRNVPLTLLGAGLLLVGLVLFIDASNFPLVGRLGISDLTRRPWEALGNLPVLGGYLMPDTLHGRLFVAVLLVSGVLVLVLARGRRARPAPVRGAAPGSVAPPPQMVRLADGREVLVVQQQHPVGTNGMAVASLVLGILGVSLLSVIFGAIGLSQIRRDGSAGRGMAIAGITISIGWTVAYVGFFVALFVAAGNA